MSRWYLLAYSYILIILTSCQADTHVVSEKENITFSDIEWITSACSSCHTMPDPKHLPRHVWDTIVLPRMGQFLGRYSTTRERRELLAADAHAKSLLLQKNIYPEHAVYDDDQWTRIRKYFLENSPDSLPKPNLNVEESANFTPLYPEVFISPPSTTFVEIESTGRILIGDVNKESLMAFTPTLKSLGSIPAGRGVTDMIHLDQVSFATVIGSFSPTDASTGKIIKADAQGIHTIADKLQRPTSLAVLDTNVDGQQDIIVTEFGKWTGKLSVWVEDANGTWQPEILSDKPGAIQVVVEERKHPTVLVLYGQGNESIDRITFLPNGEKKIETIIKFPPYYGSSALKILDWNGDEYPDLMYTNGDNADYRAFVKPYHGVRIFLGQSDGKFLEDTFLPLPGAYESQVADFDQDGDKDIAVVAFFPDFTQVRPLSAVILRNNGLGKWSYHPLPGSTTGRYIRLALGDVDHDGDMDLIAGSLAMEPVPDHGRLQAWVKNGLPFVLWQNNTKN